MILRQFQESITLSTELCGRRLLWYFLSSDEMHALFAVGVSNEKFLSTFFSFSWPWFQRRDSSVVSEKETHATQSLSGITLEMNCMKETDTIALPLSFIRRIGYHFSYFCWHMKQGISSTRKTSLRCTRREETQERTQQHPWLKKKSHRWLISCLLRFLVTFNQDCFTFVSANYFWQSKEAAKKFLSKWIDGHW